MSIAGLAKTVATAAVAALLSSCSALGLERDPTTTIVLIDKSGSIAPEDREIFAQSLATIVSQLEGGDRLLIGQVGDEGRSEFRPLLDLIVVRTNVRLDQEDAVREAQARVSDAIPSILAADTAGAASSTRITGTIAAAAQAFGSQPERGDRLILLSDGVEESSIIQLDEGADAGQIQAAVDRLREVGTLPNLEHTELSVVGAGGANYGDVEAFWRAYASASGARLVTYGRLPLQAER